MDCTDGAHTIEQGFNQGVAVGDLDNDGFADLYVANLGPNQLFRNNGDGTFTPMPPQASNSWTTSCLVADLNGDHFPDLYDVNYLSGKDVFKRICRDETGIQSSCLPVSFDGEPDQLWLNRRDEGFDNEGEAGGVSRVDGKGLGIVAARLGHQNGLSLFVANDGIPNFFYNATPPANGKLRLTDSAVPVGLAFNGNGRSEACMGIAAGDANGDGRLDFFVTNFTEETNTLYLQLDDQLFLDATDQTGLGDSSYHLLGFGTQFLDGDLDGDLDLLIANGHIDDYRAGGRMYHMPAQGFANNGEGRYTEIPSDQLGPYFEQPHLGRGLACLDWNGDGRDDAAVSHLDAPVSLLTNTTPDPGHFISLRLVGTVSCRDAIGATALLEAGGRTLYRQLTAGDGYQARNEPLLNFGLGSAETVSRLRIRWPSGLTEEFSSVPLDTRVIAVEGTGTLWKVR